MTGSSKSGGGTVLNTSAAENTVTDALTASSGPAPLKLRAQDTEDLVVISAQLQDAIVPVMDMAFLREENLFAMVVNRFRWDIGRIDEPPALGSDEDDEAAARGEDVGGYYYRTHAALRIASVTHVASKEINLKDRGAFLNILAITADIHAETGAAEILIAFSGGAWTRLTAKGLDVMLEDLGDPWPTHRKPDHALADDGTSEV